ncbi:MAG: hypothetical protein A2784_04875 [Candidatus Chisholmbacteria bacterium RIFCSPHIGHO2_01_FULL_48_12]|uniref:SpoVT-AbrB domain-containing protein n=1 Tax=Candidatus Chisholmbacteria bacterium RIFCSPHIGHO2_01_FULL_48_12 TaxID=1797589 RepID=A0A1G1VRG3_9BACT|nr:MAG: hypothetical protein A2784_04875 [Candidatus Chisholmbacteria bacterium RIFCSPHIGHO2_01_FULL_48_12]
MSSTVAVTRQWQIYIPEEVREALAWTKPEKAKVEIKGKTIVVIPEESKLMRLAGKYRGVAVKKKVDLSKIRDRIDYSWL